MRMRPGMRYAAKRLNQHQDAGQSGALANTASVMTRVGSGGQAAYVFTPKAAHGSKAPVVLFLHGLAATDPQNYGGWIDHLVGQGYIVIYPVAEGSKMDSAERIRSNAVTGAKRALDSLSHDQVTADLNRFAMVGHSVGGGLTVQIASHARELGLPEPRALMPVQPGGSKNPTNPDDLRKLPSSALLLAVEGDQDQFADTREGRMIVDAATSIPLQQRAFVLLRSGPGLVADHYSPLSPDLRYQTEAKSSRPGRKKMLGMFGIREGEVNSLDTNGYWRLLDALLETAFSGGKSIEPVLAAAGGRPLAPSAVGLSANVSAVELDF